MYFDVQLVLVCVLSMCYFVICTNYESLVQRFIVLCVILKVRQEVCMTSFIIVLAFRKMNKMRQDER